MNLRRVVILDVATEYINAVKEAAERLPAGATRALFLGEQLAAVLTALSLMLRQQPLETQVAIGCTSRQLVDELLADVARGRPRSDLMAIDSDDQAALP